jgi:HD-GYP domain-containing protein (c-di-GMP phosphodiesterase class II)
VVSYITERRGTQFDPDVVDALLDVIERSPPLPAED